VGSGGMVKPGTFEIVVRVKDSNTIAGAKKDSYTITKIYIP
jgi:hypothetical protein